LPKKEIPVRFPEVTLCFPGWVDSCLSDPDEMYPTVEDRMRLVVGSRSNVDHRTGGPFEAAIFDLHTIVIAQLVVGDFILGGEGQPPHELVTSAEPCASAPSPGRASAASAAMPATKAPTSSASTKG
jgi:hypothetical protein